MSIEQDRPIEYVKPEIVELGKIGELTQGGGLSPGDSGLDAQLDPGLS